MTQVRQWVKAHRVATFVVLTAVMLTVGVVLNWVSPDLPEAQHATSLQRFDEGALRAGASLDYLFMVAYAAWG